MSGTDELAAALGGPVPAGVEQLGDAAMLQLASLVDGAQARQSAQLEDAVRDGLGHVPRPLRLLVKKMLF